MVKDGEVPRSDGGYGWVVVGCSFVLHMLTTGTMFSLSVLYVSWLEEFGTTKSETSWVVSIGVAILFGIGPVPAYLAQFIGYRNTCILGSVVGCLGFVLSSFATSVNMLVVTIGVIAGVGLGFCYLPAVATVAQYFNNRRALALGICTSGAGIGSFIQAPLIDFLERTYGWRGTLLIVAAILLHNAVCGLLLGPVDRMSLANKNVTIAVECIESDEEDRTVESQTYGEEEELKVDEEKKLLQKSTPTLTVSADDRELAGVRGQYDHPAASVPTATRLSDSRDSAVSGVASEMSVDHEASPSMIRHFLTKHSMLVPTSAASPHLMTGSARHLPPTAMVASRNISSVADLRTESELKHRFLSADGKGGQHLSNNGLILRNIDIMLSGSIHSLRYLGENKLSYMNLHVERYSDSLETSESGTLNIDQKDSCRYFRGVGGSVISFIKFFSLLRNKVFFVLAVSTTLTNLSFLMPVLYMVDRAVENGIDKSIGAIFVSLNGAGHVFGKLFFALVAGHRGVDSLILYIFVLAICGLGTCASPLCGSSVALHAIFAFFFGSFIGGYCSLGPVVVVDLLGVDKVGQAYGILLFFAGVAGSVGPPLAGWVYAWTGDFILAFLIHGVLIALSALIMLPFISPSRCRPCARQSDTEDG